MNSNIEIDSYCGLCCRECSYKDGCRGCSVTCGNPPWVNEKVRCEIADCVNKKRTAGGVLNFCGECQEFPCDIIKSYSNDKEHGDSPAGARIERCRSLKTAKVMEARSELPCEFAYCGLHCDLCFLGQWCGGCRSDYNCCSYATVFPDKVCPNVKCAEAHGFTGAEQGCWNCPELEHCRTGFFDGNNGFLAKASSIFIQRHGMTACSEMLKKSAAAGIDYKDGFEKPGSLEGAVSLMEKYL